MTCVAVGCSRLAEIEGVVSMPDDIRSNRPLSERVRDIKLIEKALVRAVAAALRRHKQAGNPIAIWRDGRVVLLQPDEIPESTE
ncbi:MAG: hypothetical protein C5B56_13970 [Proteobacteria bacterium]|nr:MAG: hypothetical protein C5B56_13970 [Pseudomonadota bacterium]